DLCMGVLSDNPLFFLINSYTTGFSPIVLENVLSTTIGKKTNTPLSDDTLNKCASEMAGLDTGYHVHVAEGLADLQYNVDKYGKRV
ncbi:hypothetical protein ACTPEM_23535, partial [Clostridioides difficile]